MRLNRMAKRSNEESRGVIKHPFCLQMARHEPSEGTFSFRRGSSDRRLDIPRSGS
jgi:hypothetical protein